MSKHFVGTVGVDSGQVCIVDPCNVWEDEFKYNDEPTGGPYDTLCRITTGETPFGDFDIGVVSSTGYGDGAYKVWSEIEEDSGRVKSLTIVFIEEDEEY
jgi:hypothetical protein